MEQLPVDMMWFRVMAGLMVGLVMGSFTTMLSYRVPRGISIVRPASHCPSCKTPLRKRDLIPVLSWVVAKGKCTYCKVAIGARYVFIELVTALGITVAFAVMGFTLGVVPAIVAVVALVTVITIKLERVKPVT